MNQVNLGNKFAHPGHIAVLEVLRRRARVGVDDERHVEDEPHGDVRDAEVGEIVEHLADARLLDGFRLARVPRRKGVAAISRYVSVSGSQGR